MARPLRVEYPGAFYHVISRGNAGDDIFKSVRDREKFYKYLQLASERFAIKIHAFCLMTNHYHLLVETPEANLSRAIQWVNVSYAVYFNRKRFRKGHLFQGRYKAILVEADEYLKHLSRYVHLNPLRARMVKDLSSYPWSSYTSYTGASEPPIWLEMAWLLTLFGSRRQEAQKAYREFVESVDAHSLKSPEVDLKGGFILGSEDFEQWVKKVFLSEMPDEKEMPQLRNLKPTVSAERILGKVCTVYGCSCEDLQAKGRKRNLPRDVSIYLTRSLTKLSSKEIGEIYGGVSGAAITMVSRKIATLLNTEKKFRREIEQLRRSIFNI